MPLVCHIIVSHVLFVAVSDVDKHVNWGLSFSYLPSPSLTFFQSFFPVSPPVCFLFFRFYPFPSPISFLLSLTVLLQHGSADTVVRANNVKYRKCGLGVFNSQTP